MVSRSVKWRQCPAEYRRYGAKIKAASAGSGDRDIGARESDVTGSGCGVLLKIGGGVSSNAHQPYSCGVMMMLTVE